MIKNIVWFIFIFSSASLWIYFLYYLSGPDERLQFPTTIKDIKVLESFLKEYSSSKNKLLYLLLLFSSVYLYKQSFAIPGSVFLNLLAGSLFGSLYGFLLCSILSAIGASCCFLLSKYLTYVLLFSYFPEKIKNFQKMVESKRENLFYFLLSLRLFPMTPNWLLNMSSPLAKVPLTYFFFSVFFGLMPYNFLTAQAGTFLSQISSANDIFSIKIIGGLTLLALAVLGPTLLKRKEKI